MKRSVSVVVFAGLVSFTGCVEPDPPPDAGVADAGDDDAGPIAFCPERLRFTALSDGVIHVGWTGITHNATLSVGGQFVVDVTNCDNECRNCAFEGPIKDPEVNLQRCVTDTRVACNEAADCPPFACIPVAPGVTVCEDTFAPCGGAADCNPGECSVFLGANTSSPIRNTCFAGAFRRLDDAPPVQGRIDLFTGAVSFDEFGFWITTSNDNVNRGFCPTCEGDVTRNDGVKDGTCTASVYESPAGVDGQPDITHPLSVGGACDAHGSGSVRDRAGVYSLDCAAPMAPLFDLSTTNAGSAASLEWRLVDGEQPACADGPCWCGICEGTNTACHEQGDCPAGIACVGSVEAPAATPRNNRCVDECVWDNETLQGLCNTPVAAGVDGGPPQLGPTPCLPRGPDASIQVSGSSQILDERSFSIESVALGCAGPASVAFTNAALGLPGPNVSVYRMRVDME